MANQLRSAGGEDEVLPYMRSLDERYRAASGLTERRHYSIFYSRILPSPVLVVGYNPGGDPESWDVSQLASQTYFENGEHEYVDCRYPLALAMRSYLKAVLGIDDSQLRSIPKINLIFRRSTGQDTLNIPASAAITEATPFVEEVVVRVQPKVIVFEGTTTADEFEARYCVNVIKYVDGAAIKTPNGRHAAAIYRADRADVRCLSGEVVLIALGHPSKYSRRAEWGNVVSRSRTQIAAVLGL